MLPSTVEIGSIKADKGICSVWLCEIGHGSRRAVFVADSEK